MIFRCIGLALSQLVYRRFLGIVAGGVAASLAALFGLYWILRSVFLAVIGEGFSLPLIGHTGPSAAAADWASLIAVIGASVFLMVPIAQAVQSLFLDSVADAVERRHYPALPAARAVPWGEAIQDGLRAFAILIGANILMLVVYIAIPPLAPIIFFAINGLLIGREYFQVVAARRLSAADSARLRQQNLASIWTMGGVMVAALTVPIVNLFVPVLAAASFTHLFHQFNWDR